MALVHVEKRALESQRATELYVTATSEPGAPGEQAVDEMYSAVADALRAAGGVVFQERVFAAEHSAEAIPAVRARALGGLDDGLGPTLLLAPPAAGGEVAAVQVHAVCTDNRPALLASCGTPRGRALPVGDQQHIALCGLSAPGAGTPPTQTWAIFEMAEELLRQADGDMRSVGRTWLWLGDILSWYDDFNATRNRFFAERGLMDGQLIETCLPASTGIGVLPGDGARCSLDVRAVVGPGELIRRYSADGRQNPPHCYGSAFSRAATVATPAGQTLFVSGTASINAEGLTVYAGDPRRQIEHTLANVRAVLGSHDCRDQDVVAAIAYCKTPEVEALWRAGWADLPWPCVTLIADVCREELAFELELTACPGAKQA